MSNFKKKSLKEIGDEITDMETALAGICLMIGYTLNQKILEEEKDNPDFNKIRLVNAELDTYFYEKKLIYSGNKDMVNKVLDIYSSILLNRAQNEI